MWHGSLKKVWACLLLLDFETEVSVDVAMHITSILVRMRIAVLNGMDGLDVIKQSIVLLRTKKKKKKSLRQIAVSMIPSEA